VDLRTAEAAGVDVLAGDGLHDPRPGEEHVGVVGHHDEVHQRRRVGRPAGAGPEDQCDLRDPPRGRDVGAEHLAVPVQRRDALLDAGPTGVVDPDDRDAALGGLLDRPGDLVGVGLAERAAEHAPVLRVHVDRLPRDRPGTGDHAVGVGAALVQPEAVRAVSPLRAELDERARVEQPVEPDPRPVAGLEHARIDGGGLRLQRL
jgi:hypothetical protein